MREILFRGKTSDGEWVEGFYLYTNENTQPVIIDMECCSNVIIPETVGQYTGLVDKNGIKIFEGDIVQYGTYWVCDCQSVVKFGEYNQDGSAGEYSARKCIGFYVDVDNFTGWCEYDPDFFPKYLKQQNILEVASYCEVIGNIHDNPELLETTAKPAAKNIAQSGLAPATENFELMES